MELCSDSTQMISVKTLELCEESRSEDGQECVVQEGGWAKTQEGEGDTEDRFGAGSVTSSLPADTDPPGAEAHAEPAGCSQQPVSLTAQEDDQQHNMALHTSPLESIKELNEVDGQGMEDFELERSLRDEAVKAKGQVVEKQSPHIPGEASSKAEGTSGDTGPPSGTSLMLTLSPDSTCDKLNNPDADHSRCPLGTSADGFFKGESQETEAGDAWEEKERDSLSGTATNKKQECRNVTETCETATSTNELLYSKLQQPSHQTTTNHAWSKQNELRDSKGEVDDDFNSETKRCESHFGKIQQVEIKGANDSLIEILTECKSKVEELEELKHSSHDLKIQLQAAQGTAAHLQQRMLSLEEEQSHRQQQMRELTRELEAARRALQEKSEETARVTAQLRALHQEVLERSQEKEALANGHTVERHHPQPSKDSRVCVIL